MYIVLAIIASVILMVVGQVVIKKGLNLLRGIDFSAGFITSYLRIFLSSHVVVGAILYVVSVFFWLYALSKVDLSYAYPLIALSYVLVPLASWLVLGEHITLLRWIGVFVICIGVLLVAKSYYGWSLMLNSLYPSTLPKMNLVLRGRR